MNTAVAKADIELRTNSATCFDSFGFKKKFRLTRLKYLLGQ